MSTAAPDPVPAEPRPRPGRVHAATLAPGLLVVAVIVGIASALALVPGLKLFGALGLALLVGLAVRVTLGAPAQVRPGAAYAARTLLRLGIVLLGVRLDFALLARSGPAVIALDALVITAGVLTVERVGRLLGMSRSLRLTLALGSSICGSSAIAAAAPVVGANDDEVSVAVGVASLFGLLGVIGYTVLGPLTGMDPHRYGLMTGSTLYDVGQVLAAGAARGADALDLATVTKLARVALLAPTLVVVSAVLARRGAARAAGAARAPLLPAFIVGFLAVGALNSLGAVPVAARAPLETIGHYATAAAMAGIGLGVDVAAIRRVGAKAAVLGLCGFAVLVAVSAAFTGLVAR